MSTFEKLFEVFWCSAGIIWNCFLAVKIGTEYDKPNRECIISLMIIANLTAFILAKLSW